MASQLVIAQTTKAPTPQPVVTRGPRETYENGLRVYYGVAGEAVAQGNDPVTLLGVFEAAISSRAWTSQKVRVSFLPETAEGDCAGSPLDAGILEITYGQIRSRDDNYFVAEHFAKIVRLGARLMSCDGKTVAAEYPNKRLMFAETASHYNAAAFASIAGAASILNAKNEDKTAAAVVTFTGSFKSLEYPIYDHNDIQYAVEWSAVQDAMNASFGKCIFMAGKAPTC